MGLGQILHNTCASQLMFFCADQRLDNSSCSLNRNLNKLDVHRWHCHQQSAVARGNSAPHGEKVTLYHLMWNGSWNLMCPVDNTISYSQYITFPFFFLLGWIVKACCTWGLVAGTAKNFWDKSRNSNASPSISNPWSWIPVYWWCCFFSLHLIKPGNICFLDSQWLQIRSI